MTFQNQNYKLFIRKFEAKNNLQVVPCDSEKEIRNEKAAAQARRKKRGGSNFNSKDTGSLAIEDIENKYTYETMLIQTLFSLTEAISEMNIQRKGVLNDRPDAENPWIIVARIMDRFFMLLLFIIIILINIVLIGVLPNI